MNGRALAITLAAALASMALLAGASLAAPGTDISNLARTTSETGADKGAAISAAAQAIGPQNAATDEDTAADTDTDADVNDEAGANANSGHGAEVSALAKSTPPGPDHGAIVSALASAGAQANGTPPGAAIADLAKTTTETGQAKGQAISAAAKALH